MESTSPARSAGSTSGPNGTRNLAEEATVTSIPPTQSIGRLPENPELAGHVIAGYQLTRKVAEGGMGVVYEAIQLKLDRKVALKVLTQQLSSLPEFLKRFEREAKAAAALNHPNIVQVHDFGEAAGHSYMIMEFVEGEDLSSYVETHGKLSVPEALEAVQQAASALKAAYEKSIIHRDIKPSNLLRTHDGQIKVADLGLAKVLNQNAEMTATGVGIGSPYFIAPEQAADASTVDHRADIYSLGITLFFLLTGKRPFDGATPYSIVLAHVNKDLPNGAAVGTELPQEVERLIQRMAAKDPEDRYPDYDALLADLQAVKAGGKPALKTVASTRRTRRLYVAAAAVGLLLVAGAVAIFRPTPEATISPKKEVVFVPGENAGEGSALVQMNDTEPSVEPLHERPREGMRPRPTGRMREGNSGPRGERGPMVDAERGGEGGEMKAFLMRPLGPPDFADRAPLTDGPITAMETEAEALGKRVPVNYMLVINAYNQILDKAAGTREGRRIQARLDQWIAEHKEAAQKEIASLKAKMELELRNGNARAAHNLWGDFPSTLRSREVDEQIVQILTTSLPKDYLPQ